MRGSASALAKLEARITLVEGLADIVRTRVREERGTLTDADITELLAMFREYTRMLTVEYQKRDKLLGRRSST